MAKPNKTVAKFRKKVPFFTPEEEEVNRASRMERSRKDKPEFWAIMDAVSEGRMTPEDAAKAMKDIEG